MLRRAPVPPTVVLSSALSAMPRSHVRPGGPKRDPTQRAGFGVDGGEIVRMHKPKPYSILGVQCQPAPGGRGVVVDELHPEGRAAASNLRSSPLRASPLISSPVPSILHI